MLRYPPFNVQVVGMEKKRCHGQASNNQAWWVERIAGNKRKTDTCRWVWPERLGDDATRRAPPTKQANNMKQKGYMPQGQTHTA